MMMSWPPQMPELKSAENSREISMPNPTLSAAESLYAAWLNQDRSGAGWLQQLQLDAIKEFERSGFPSSRAEDWKYTDVRKLALAYPDWLATSPVVGANTPDDSLEIPGAIHLRFVDGVFLPERSSTDLPENLYAGPARDIDTSLGTNVGQGFGHLTAARNTGFVALNTAFTDTVVVLILPDNTCLDRPVYISHFSSTAETGTHPRLYVELGKNSTATIVEHASGNQPAIVNAVTEINCRQGSQLHYYRLQETHCDSWNTAVQHIEVAHDASVTTTTIDTGGGISRNELYVRLAGAGAAAEAKGLLLADGSKHVESRITVEHAAPNTQSRERYRAILADKAHGVFNGKILVQQAAQKTAAELTNRNLLLTRGAEINTKPELEIYADDVKCAHGSTTGRLDETSLFYLLSRGIEPVTARNILVRAFAIELLTDMTVPAIAARAQAALESLKFGEL
jgi:Fe-S cluster assembly protein SufD